MRADAYFSLQALTRATIWFAGLLLFGLLALVVLGTGVAMYKGTPLQLGFLETIPSSRWIQLLLVFTAISMLGGSLRCVVNWLRDRIDWRAH